MFRKQFFCKPFRSFFNELRNLRIQFENCSLRFVKSLYKLFQVLIKSSKRFKFINEVYYRILFRMPSESTRLCLLYTLDETCFQIFCRWSILPLNRKPSLESVGLPWQFASTRDIRTTRVNLHSFVI